jgi:predicted Zn-dependent protease
MNWLRALKEVMGIEETGTSRSCRLNGRPNLEQLETRLVPYAVTGNAWPNPQLITISFVPDGTLIGTNGTQQVGSNLFATFDAKFGSAAAWQDIILKAAQVWAQQTNINFTVVPDDGAPIGSGNYQQGDPNMGDIRIGGYNFGNSVLGMTYYPPNANNYSIGGDVALNTGEPFNNGSTYDLFTVASHEIGHALGLGESSVPSSIEYANYNGVKTALASDDIEGIRNIYSDNNPRTPDAFASAAAPNSSFTAAANINSSISSSSLTAELSNLDIATTSTVEYFTFTAPSTTSGTLNVDVQSSGLSLLAPKMTVYAANQSTVLGSASALGDVTGATLSVAVSNVTAGEQFYVKVQGTDNTAFSTGDYALTLSFNGGAAPKAPSPMISIANGTPLKGGGGYADNSTDALYLDSVPVITGISPTTGSSNTDGVTNSSRISFTGVAPILTIVNLYEVIGGKGVWIASTLALTNYWAINYTNHPFADGTYIFYATSAPLTALLGLGGESNPSTVYPVTIDTVAPPAPVISGFSPQSTSTSGNVSSSATPTLSGTAQANSTVEIFRNGTLLGSTPATSSGSWSYTVSSALSNGSYSFTAKAVDLAGNTSVSSAALVITVDAAGNSTSSSGSGTPTLAAPLLEPSSIQSIANNGTIYTTATPTFFGSTPAGTTITIMNGSTILGTVVANANGQWSFTCPTLASGNYSITVFDTDAFGDSGSSSAALKFTVG